VQQTDSTLEKGLTSPVLPSPVLELRGRNLEWGRRTYVMAILNMTPDSFSGDGLGRDLDAAMARAEQAMADGADILDVGGESTRPGAAPVNADEESRRVVHVIDAIVSRLGATVSVDTSKAVVARRALEAGAEIVNDVWSLRADQGLAGVCAATGAAVVLMHNRSDPARVGADPIVGGHYEGIEYGDVTDDVIAELRPSIQHALAAGISSGRIVVDPGIGFGKTPAQNLELLDQTCRLRELGYPVLVGPSRKSFIGATLGLAPGDRLEGTAAAVAVAIARGADIVRVHDTQTMVRVARMTDAIVRR
jgi:dihydropteroate synthase